VIRIRRAEQRLAKLVAAMIEKAANELDAICINDMMRHRCDISATANADGNDIKVRIGGDLFQEGMGGNIEHWDVRRRYHVVIPTNLALERCFPVSELMEGRQPTPFQRHPLLGRGGRAKVFRQGMRTSMISRTRMIIMVQVPCHFLLR